MLTGLAGQVLTGRWLMVFASLLLMVTAGASYMFGLYSNDIKSVLGYDQTTLNMVSFSKDLGASFGLFAGLVNEVAPPWVVLSIGAVLNFFGNFMVWLAVTKKIPAPRVWHLCLYIAVGANSHTFTNTGALVTCVTNFPGSRGAVLGLLKGYTGISAAVIAQLYRGLYGADSTRSFTLFVAWLPTALSFASLGTIRVLAPRGNNKNGDDDDVDVFYKFLYTSLCLAAYLLVIIVVEGSVSFDRAQYGFSAVAVLLLLFLPMVVVVSEEYKLLKLKKKKSSAIELMSSSSSAYNKSMKNKKETPSKNNKEGRWWENALKPPAIGDDFTILQAVLSVEMLTLVLSTVCGIGGNMTMIDNLGQIGASFGYPQRKITNFVSLTSIWSYLGQITAGFLSEALITKYKFPRPVFLTLVLLFSSVGHLLVAFNVPNGLYAASIIIGFCFGAIWPLIYTVVSELFGLKYYSTLYNVGPMSIPVGLYLLNVKVAGNYYDREARRQLEARGLSRQAGQALNCLGGECFRLSFIIITVVTLFGAVVSLFLVARTREFYKGDIYKRFRDDDVAVAREVIDGGGAKVAGNDTHMAVV